MHKYIDAHCHLQHSENPCDVMINAQSYGIVGAICNSATSNDWDDILALHKKCKNIYSCIGVHPWEINNIKFDWHSALHNILQNNPDVMIGECGLDKNYPDMQQQEQFFIAHLDAGHKYGRTVHIHCVGAWDRIMHILKSCGKNLPPKIVAHSFAGPANIIEQLATKYNAYFSYSPMITDSRYRRAIDALINTPQNRILIESDSDNPSVVIDVANAVAKIKSIAADKMSDIIYNNTITVLTDGQITQNAIITGG